MFDKFKDLAGLPGMLAKAGAMKGRMADMQKGVAEKLGQLRVEADAGGGMVTATCNGKLELVRLKIDAARLNPATAKPEDLELLEDLIVAAVAAAQQKAQLQSAELTQKEMAKLAEELGLPPGMLGEMPKFE